MRDRTPRIGRTRRCHGMAFDQDGESELAFSSSRLSRLTSHGYLAGGIFDWGWEHVPFRAKEFVVERIARGEKIGDLPKNCHLLPSTAILEPQNRYARFNVLYPFRSRDRPAGLDPRLRN